MWMKSSKVREYGEQRREKGRREEEGSRLRFTVYLLGEGLQDSPWIIRSDNFTSCKKFIHLFIHS